MAKPLQRQVLEQARELLKDPNNWVQGDYWEYGYDEYGNYVMTNRFCLIGAVRYAGGVDMKNHTIRELELNGLIPPHVAAAEKALAEAASEKDPDIKNFLLAREIVTEYNDDDNRTHEEILAVLDKALERI